MNKFTLTATSAFAIMLLSSCGGGGGGGGGGAPAAPVIVAPPPPPLPAGTVLLNWTAPATNVDGSPAAISGYNVYRLLPGTTPCSTDISTYAIIPPIPASGLATVVGTPAPTTYTDNGLAAGDYCYGVTAVNNFGQESVPTFLASPITVT